MKNFLRNSGLFLLILVFGLSLYLPAKNKLDTSDLTFIYELAVQGGYPYMFQGRVQVGGEGSNTYKGKYTAGFKGMFIYSNLSKAVTTFLNEKRGMNVERPKDFYNLDVYEKLTGMKAFTNVDRVFEPFGLQVDSQNTFHHYNKKIVQWGIKNLIPSPEMKLGDVTAQDYYNDVYADFFRQLVEGYLYMQQHGIEKETQAYKDAYSTDGYFDGKDYLGKKYRSAFTGYSNYYGGFSPSLACGFWMRRNIDGTHDLFWKGLDKIMNDFDKEWFEATKTKYAQ